jgi:hypothetical protein
VPCRCGTQCACDIGVGVRDFRDLVAWQLSHELKCEVLAFTDTGPAARDFRYRDDIRSSSASAPSNISEGFGRFRARLRPLSRVRQSVAAGNTESSDRRPGSPLSHRATVQAALEPLESSGTRHDESLAIEATSGCERASPQSNNGSAAARRLKGTVEDSCQHVAGQLPARCSVSSQHVAASAPSTLQPQLPARCSLSSQHVAASAPSTLQR